jgi:RimJ/RimL family protein N-acetyltransferase
MNKIELLKVADNLDNYKLLYKWCSNKNVYEWFEQRVLTLDEIVKKYSNKLKGNKQDLYIIRYDNKKIGFVQIYKYNDEIDTYNNIYEYDIFIGEEDYLSKGIGSIIVGYIDRYIFNNYKSDLIVLRPFKRNVRAIKCYMKNGYKVLKEYEDYDTLGNKEQYVMLIKEKI